MSTTSTPSRPATFQTLELHRRALSSHWKFTLVLLAALALSGLRASALVVLAEEYFNNNSAAGWIERDTAMPVTYASGFSNPTGPGTPVGSQPGSLLGTFSAQGEPAYEVDAFRADSGSSSGNFSGDLYRYTGINQISFAFYAEDLLPSTFIFRLIDTSDNVFFYNISPQLTSVATWTTVDVSLVWSANWFGGSGLDFSNAVGSVQFLDVQVARNGTGAQNYYLDNFILSNTIVDVLTSVPEPASFSLFLVGMFALRIARKHQRASLAPLPYARRA